MTVHVSSHPMTRPQDGRTVQRCAWCGALLTNRLPDDTLPDVETDAPIAVEWPLWPGGGMVTSDGAWLPDDFTADVPEGACWLQEPA